MDSQSTEIIGRNLLVSQLVRDGLEVARPERDRGVDLVAYLDLDEAGGGFVAVPIQMKAATKATFGIARKYEKFRGMLFAHLWRVHEPEHACTYALTYIEALQVAEQMGWTDTESWTLKDRYETTHPSRRLLDLLEPYLMRPGDWKGRVTGVAGSFS
ncbi:MAG: hypothetical protein M3Y91_08760 [Actinomycetota bacterium]|nr:hypothetical protein [Actinomycetota bacterium]